MNKKIILLVAVFATLVLASCSAKSPQISIDQYDFTFGDVVNGTIVSKDLVIENSGGSPLAIEAVSTSCGCTTAKIEPQTISPGAKGVLHIEFDSGAHGPEMTGELIRQIFITTNDSNNPEVKVEFSVNVTK